MEILRSTMGFQLVNPINEDKGTMTGGYEGGARCFTLESTLTRAHRKLPS